MGTEQREKARELYRRALPTGGSGTLEERRAGYESLLVTLPLDDRATVTVEYGEDGAIAGYWVDGSSGTSPARSALMLHGGGYVIGSAKGYLSLASRIAVQTGSIVYAAEYPLAPENPYPTALRVVERAWDMVNSRAKHSFLIGDSAGGGLALALACSLRDSGAPLPEAIALFSPLTDLSASSDTYDLNADRDPICSRRGIMRAAEWYLEGVAPETVPLGSPLHADLAGLPPMHIHVSTDEVLLHDSTGLADAVARARGSVTLRARPDMVHVWPLFWSFLDEGSVAIDEVARFFDEAESVTEHTG